MNFPTGTYLGISHQANCTKFFHEIICFVFHSHVIVVVVSLHFCNIKVFSPFDIGSVMC